ncbi:DUF4342 domain-containing protein [Geosporobacter ferrireducens]|uniref:Ubiquitin n=1 Tax=Geosporobacter ferrireducens TaxID=1424294 RepID=A0A1D8GC70_9FIRM|nr:DUF4342 domain-containing protein [Geosporobacter ferrireducens]AOT68513.1 ubiquitin [Geosporobacter ferrireducens]MTI53974.1 DUF4342 domain-containing protein [Geosporobacter ferrireducens]
MEITLEKIDQVRERTGVSYKEAKEALEAAAGNVVDAIVHIEERQNIRWTDNFAGAGNEILEKLKAVVKKGNVTKILLKRDGEVIMNIPVTAGAIGAILSPPIAMVGVFTAFATKCKIEIVKDTGEVLDLNEIADDTYNSVRSKVDELKTKVNATEKEKRDGEEE